MPILEHVVDARPTEFGNLLCVVLQRLCVIGTYGGVSGRKIVWPNKNRFGGIMRLAAERAFDSDSTVSQS